MPRKPFLSSSTLSVPGPSTAPSPSTFHDGLPLPKLFVFDLDYTLWPFWCDTHCTPPLKPVQPRQSSSENGSGSNSSSITKMKDRYGEEYGFYPGVSSILYAARQKGITMSVASRTHAPHVAEQLLNGLTVSTPKPAPAGMEHQQDESRTEQQLQPQPQSVQEARDSSSASSSPSKPTKAIDFFFAPQMYPGSKVAHFRKIQKATKRLPPPPPPPQQRQEQAGSQRGQESGEVAFADMLFFDDESRNRNVETELGVTFVMVRDGVTREEVDKGVWEWRKRRGFGAGAGARVRGEREWEDGDEKQ